jgi:hypothetical protein
MNRKMIRLVVGSALAGCLLGAAAFAHHAGTNFDTTKQFVYKGAVKKWLWVNPHSWLYVEVSKADGTSELWGFEAGGPNMLGRSGWKANSLKPGDTITVYAAPDRQGQRNGLLQKVIMDDGKVLSTGGPGSPPPDATPGAPPPGLGPLPGSAPVTPVEYK